ncbi:TetR/AcrR family transcriptional regulator [Nocardioides humilatus]|uniref:TetR/AcrR family transcriptional regulator n=1 Tax=Nocardioides humilatus TaxID=2607660 RepID=A0A5B1L9S5_9ACTN|nr:TetR/AcrR family transcriptional regulator [Nocardioides humilatus]KAA1416958.1 TetR/AcrR family transcriptional regulator [Nocardioides humilatus]
MAVRTNRGRSKGKARGPVGSTSDAIYRAAEDLFFERGYGGTTLRDVADAVDLQVGSLYNHIESKEALLFAIMKSSLDGVLSAVDAAVDGVEEPLLRLEAFMKATIGYYGTHMRESFIGSTELRSLPTVSRRKIQKLRDAYEDRLIRILEDAVAQGADIPHVTMAAYALIAISSHVASWYHEDGPLSLDEVADQLVRTYAPLAALRAPIR